MTSLSKKVKSVSIDTQPREARLNRNALRVIGGSGVNYVPPRNFDLEHRTANDHKPEGLYY